MVVNFFKGIFAENKNQDQNNNHIIMLSCIFNIIVDTIIISLLWLAKFIVKRIHTTLTFR